MNSTLPRRLSPGRLPLLLSASAAGLVLFLAGCTGEKASSAGFKFPPMPVETALVTAGPIAERFETVGALEASNMITVVAEIDGTVRSLPFREGDTIEAGGLIAQLDDEQLAAEVARASALRDQNRISYERIKAVVDQGAGAPQDLDDANAALKVAEANLSLAQARLAKTRVTAPFHGMLGARRISPGAFLRAGEPITDLAHLEDIRVGFSAPERFVSKLQAGASVRVTTLAFPDVELEGHVEVIEPLVDATTRSVHVLAHIPKSDVRLRPGMSANVSLVLEERPNALVIPSEAIFVQGNQPLVYVVGADSTVSPAPVSLGTRLPDKVEILGGLAEGARVVRAGHQKLFPGAKVIPIMSQPGAAPAPASAAVGG